MSDLGTDFSLGPDGLAPLFPTISGPLLVAQAIYRRWTTSAASEAGRRIYGGECADLRDLLGSRADATTDKGWEQRLRQLARADERVEDCAVTLTRTDSGKRVTVRAQLTISGQAIQMVIALPDLTTEVILGG